MVEVLRIGLRIGLSNNRRKLWKLLVLGKNLLLWV